jgi:hypothetical protein
MVKRMPGLSLELAKAHAQITNGQIVELTGANRNAVKKHLQMLVSPATLSSTSVAREVAIPSPALFAQSQFCLPRCK